MNPPAPGVETILSDAVQIPSEDDRCAYLDRACGDDAALRARLDRLVADHFRAGDFLERPPMDLPPDETVTLTPGVADLAAGGKVGPYKLLQRIGDGGMGTVWMADQTEPIKRRVAVKLIHAERGNSKTILARFEAERQAIALMDHPHIAKLFDAGTTDAGQPYFVMELVKGIPLTDYCDTHKLNVQQRLGLFQQICSAVQHAHQKGIIHRDLKPTNILVESHDGKAVPKVIDFGLAKATSGLQLTEHSVFTAFGSVMGTPLYMAPEQATFNAVDVDTRADIYALGVILYELLTGTTPLTRDTAKKAALDEMLKLVREQEAPSPSSRLSSSDSKPSVAANRQSEPAKLGRFVKGELDWIVLKALSKERDRRYETANGFAKDIERFLNHEPVQAGPVGAAYKLRKFVRRNRGQVLAASLVLFALLAGIAGTTVGLIRANRAAEAERVAKEEAEDQKGNALRSAEREAEERKKADAAKVEAQAKEAEANAVVKFFEDQVFAAARPKNQDGGLGAGVTLRDAVAASVPALEKAFAEQPLVEARLRKALGTTFSYLAEHEQARDQRERARALYIRHLGPDHSDTLRSMNNLATSYAALNRPADALKLEEETLAIQKRVLPKDHPDTLTSMMNLAISYSVLNRPADALKLNEETLAIRRRVLPKDHPHTLQSMMGLAHSYSVLNRPGDALKLHEETLEIQKRVLPKDHPDTLLSMNDLAVSYLDLNRPTDAVKLLEETLAIQKRVLPQDHPDALRSMMNLANSYSALNRPADALKLREETLAIQKRVLPKDHPHTLMNMHNLASSYRVLNRPADALKLSEETLAIQKRVLPKDHPVTLRSMNEVASSYSALKRHADALKLREETLAIRKRVLPPDHPDTLKTMVNLADSLIQLDRGVEAIPLLDQFLAKARTSPAVDRRLIPMAISLRAKHFQKTGDPAGCRATAELWEKLNRTDAGSLYDAACFRAIAGGVQAKTPGADAARLAKEDSDRAMEWLHKAVQSGYKDWANMKKDADLDPVREREDFKKLLAELEKKAEKK